jgi:thymidylate synthase
MNNSEQVYLDALRDILNTGEHRPDRTGTGTISKFGLQLKFDLQQGFPAITTKRLAWKSVVSELLWFIEGSGDENRLKEILYGSRNSTESTIWSGNANADYWKSKARFKGDLGRIYGVQWRTWRAPIFGANRMAVKHIDQLQLLINGIKKDPYGRRHIISSWNPGELDSMALPPCHMMAQFYVSGTGKLSCHMYQRSADMFLGVPFNIASYALFTHMIAQVCKLSVGELIISFGDAHIYDNHLEQVREQLTREPLDFPTLELNPVDGITMFKMNDIKLIGYNCHTSIKAPMAV